MRLRYKASFAESLAFQQSYYREFEKKASPAWFRNLSIFLLLAGVFAIGYALFPVPDRLIALYAGAFVFGWLWELGHSYCYRLFVSRYLRESDDAEEQVAEVGDGRYTHENRGIRLSLPLSALSMAYERDGFVYLYFGRLGASRLPFAAFDSADQRSAFLQLVNSEKEKLNRPPTPTVGRG